MLAGPHFFQCAWGPHPHALAARALALAAAQGCRSRALGGAAHAALHSVASRGPQALNPEPAHRTVTVAELKVSGSGTPSGLLATPLT